jgi:hypothetical protein
MKKICPICGFEFEILTSSKYCSEKCRHEAKILKQYSQRIERKRGVIAHYGGMCSCCGENHIEFLTIDHINGGGNAERRKIFGLEKKVGSRFYEWLIHNNFPEGYQVLCADCNMAKGRSKAIHCPVHHPEEY